jgi:mannose-6-phosphate isomerase-like protein (cupin superfamily)
MTDAMSLASIRGDVHSVRMGRITLTFKPDHAGSAYSLCESLSEPGAVGADPHRHASYEETHIVIEGEYEFTIGPEVVRLGPGGMAYMPRGVLHAIRKVDQGVGRQLIVSSPAGVFEAFIREVVAARAEAEAQGLTFDIRPVAERHDVEFV